MSLQHIAFSPFYTGSTGVVGSFSMAPLRWTDLLSLPDLNLFVGQLTSEQKSNPCVLHALNVQRALSMGNYHLFFSLYNTVPNMGGYIMDHFVERERIRALLVMTKSCVSTNIMFPAPTLTSSPAQVHLGTSDFHRQRTRVRKRHGSTWLPCFPRLCHLHRPQSPRCRKGV